MACYKNKILKIIKQCKIKRSKFNIKRKVKIMQGRESVESFNPEDINLSDMYLEEDQILKSVFDSNLIAKHNRKDKNPLKTQKVRNIDQLLQDDLEKSKRLKNRRNARKNNNNFGD
jgi:hypothetical protein